MGTPKIELNPDIDLKPYIEALKEKGRIRVPNILTNESAESILNTLKKETPWHLVYTNRDSAPVKLTPSKLASLGHQEQQEIVSAIYRHAPDRYQFIYKYFPIIDAIKEGLVTDSSMLYQIATFFNGTEFMRFARDLTGSNSIVKIDTKATLYEPGHFLNVHDDQDSSDTETGIRRFAVVLGLTKNWSPNWGGNTNFYNTPNDQNFESWNPAFNSLSVFRVPVLHNVSYVVPYAPVGRYSITGWLREDANIRRPDLD